MVNTVSKAIGSRAAKLATSLRWCYSEYDDDV
jgi:hypothetical protein